MKCRQPEAIPYLPRGGALHKVDMEPERRGDRRSQICLTLEEALQL